MKTSSRSLLDGLLAKTPAQPIFSRRASRSLAVLAYHEISRPARFEEHLDLLRRIAMPVSLDQVIGAIDGRAELPERAVLITFDDGHRDVFEVAMPLLRARGIPAVAFVVAGSIGTHRPLWTTEVRHLAAAAGSADGFEGLTPSELVIALKRAPDAERLRALDELRRTAELPPPVVPQLEADDLRALESAGIDVGNHSLTHPCLSRCPTEKIVHEVGESHEVLTRILGRAPVAFAYPDGDLDPRVTDVVREAGYRVAFRFDHRLDALSPPDALGISRLRTDAHASLDRLRITVSGLHPAIHRLRGLA